MIHSVLATIIFIISQCCGQLSYGNSNYCSYCAPVSSGLGSYGFGYGSGKYGGGSYSGANYGSGSSYGSPSTFVSSIPSQNTNSYLMGNNFVPPSTANSFAMGSSGYGSNTNYGSSPSSSIGIYGSSPVDFLHLNFSKSTLNNGYGIGNTYANKNELSGCYSNNCIPSNVAINPSSAYSIHGNSNGFGVSNPSTYNMNLVAVPSVSSSNSYSSLPNTYNLPTVFSSYPVLYQGYSNQESSNVNSLNNLPVSNYQYSAKTAADDATQAKKSVPSS
ncbi:unnamed protein product [Thelazia callipaeda]|uniref:Uncharacterized protein n=1 Tax=Thelazia callipaeda TaxID=103827 RepID=A0A0N5D3V8_THECL|nr:unnamed protein product [Thelazia callipaeda]